MSIFILLVLSEHLTGYPFDRSREKYPSRRYRNSITPKTDQSKCLFQHGSMIGLNKEILCQYVEFIANHRMSAIGLGQPFDIKNNPLPWMNNYLSSDNVQVAPQESEISSYLVGQIDSEVNADDFGDFDL